MGESQLGEAESACCISVSHCFDVRLNNGRLNPVGDIRSRHNSRSDDPRDIQSRAHVIQAI